MAKLSSKDRGSLPKSDFGMPGERKYPMPDASHAGNAKARASQQEKAGNISESTKEKIDAKANKVLHGGRGMRTEHTQAKGEHHFEKSEMPKMDWE